MNYEVGDRVKIKSLDWYYETKNKYDNVDCGSTIFIPEMVKYCEKIVTISSVLPTLKVYHIKEDGGMFNWTDEMIEGLAEEEEIEFTEEDKYWCDIMSESDPTTYVLPQGYQFKDENGNIINATKIVLEKKKKEYPKTFEECCKVLGIDSTINHTIGTHFRYRDTIKHFIKLLICRDAYWKLYGEEIGLGKPWEPTEDDSVFSISRMHGKIITECHLGDCCIFEFPTKEMRNAFKENFYPDIEICKELL